MEKGFSLFDSAIAGLESSSENITLTGKTVMSFNSIFINQKQRTADNKIDLTKQALAKIILINDKVV